MSYGPLPIRMTSISKLLGSRLIASAPQTVALLAATQEEPARVVVAASADLKIDCGTLLREALASYGVRGGGSPGMAQGQIPSAHLDVLFSGLEGQFPKRLRRFQTAACAAPSAYRIRSLLN